MDKTIFISLNGSPRQYRLEEDAHDRLAQYLDRAGARLQDDPDRAEVLGDVERSVGDKLAALLGPEDRVVTSTDIDAILEEIGAVDTGVDDGTDGAERQPSGRRLHRIRAGKSLAGVCSGIAAYSDIDVGWVRTIFVLGTLVTAGLVAIAYVVLAFVLPITATPDAPISTRRRRLTRIRKGQSIAGVCNGLAAYSQIRVDWVRTLFVLATLVTAGLFGIVYAALAFFLPIVETHEMFDAERG